ncbi:MAG: CopD family protein [Nitrososphaerales archaeon]
MAIFDLVILWIHLLATIFLVGGSLFFWSVVMPIFTKGNEDEARRTILVGRLARRYGRLINWTLVVLILTGLYNLPGYLGSASIFDPSSRILLMKMVLVLVLIFFIYYNNIIYGKRIVKSAREEKTSELRTLRKKSRVFSMLNLSLMLIITLLAIFLRSPVI